MNFEASDRIKFASAVLAAAILSSGLTLGLYKVGGGCGGDGDGGGDVGFGFGFIFRRLWRLR